MPLGASLEQRFELSQTMLAADPLDEQALATHLRCLVERDRTGDAWRLFEQFRARSMQELGVEPASALRSLAKGLAGSAAPPQAPRRDVFIGRELELDQLGSMLRKAKGAVVTVTGPGGVGKSRVVLELSLRLAPSWCDGVAWVALADLSIAADALPRLAELFGLTLAPQRDTLPT